MQFYFIEERRDRYDYQLKIPSALTDMSALASLWQLVINRPLVLPQKPRPDFRRKSFEKLQTNKSFTQVRSLKTCHTHQWRKAKKTKNST